MRSKPDGIGQRRSRPLWAAAVLVTLGASFGAHAHGQELTLQKDGAPTRIEEHSAPVDPALWEALDVEGRWVHLLGAVGGYGDLGKVWTDFLVEHDERQLLEWWMLTRITSAQARSALIAQDAPEWMRATVFQLGSRDSHVTDAAKLDLGKSASVFLGWLALHEGADGTFDVEVGRLAKSLRREGNGQVVADTDRAQRYAAAYTHDELFGALAWATEAVPFGDRGRAEDGQVYEHQVERAIQAAASLARPPGPLVDQLLGIVRGGSVRLGQAAALGLTHFPPALIPADELWVVSANPERPVAVRESALLAASFGPEPRPYLELLRIVGDHEHIHWRAALSRLADFGDAFTSQELRRLENSDGIGEQAGVLSSERARLDARLEAQSRGKKTSEKARARVRVLTERLTWARRAELPFVRRYDAWVRYELSTLPADDVRETLRSLIEEGAGAEDEAEAEAGGFRSAVREQARQLLGD